MGLKSEALGPRLAVGEDGRGPETKVPMCSQREGCGGGVGTPSGPLPQGTGGLL